MKYLLLLFPLLVFPQYKIDYFETNQGVVYLKGELYVNGEESVYVKKSTDSIPEGKNMHDGFIIEEINLDNMSYGSSTVLPLTNEPFVYFNQAHDYFKFLSAKMYEKGDIIVKDSVPNIHWEIVDEIKNVLGYKCQKAIGVYRCREYIVWFTREIPIGVGPWHLNGLPGAILEARESNDYLKFEATKITEIDDYGVMKEKINNQNKYDIIIYSDYIQRLDKQSIETSKDIITEASKIELEGATIRSLKSTVSFSTYDLCREKGSTKQVQKYF